MLNAFCFLFGFQLLGTALSHVLSLPVPGPVIGLIFLLTWLLMKWPKPAELDTLLKPFMAFLPLFFVPAVVGIIQHMDALLPFAAEVASVIIISTLLGLISSVFVFVVVANKTAPAKKGERKS